jgi:hypothetical protein
MPRQSLRARQTQEFMAAYERTDAVHQRLLLGLVELLARDGIGGWVRFRDILDIGIREHAMATTKKRKH